MWEGEREGEWCLCVCLRENGHHSPYPTNGGERVWDMESWEGEGGGAVVGHSLHSPIPSIKVEAETGVGGC